MSALGTRRRILLVTSAGFPSEWVEDLRTTYSGIDLNTVSDTKEDIYAAAPGVHALINCPRPLWSDDLLELAGPSFKWLHAGGAGIEEFLTPGFVASDVVFTNGKIIQGPEVADHALGLLLNLTRRIHLIQAGHCPGDLPRPIELRGKKALVFGLGGIGMMVVERLIGFGVRVTGINPDYVPMTHMLDQVLPPERMTEVLGDMDIVICAAANTPASHHIFNEETFSLMKPSAYFVNVSRGKLVDTDGLLNVLNDGHLSGVGLDVSDPEPLPDDHPLRSIERAILTPHIAGLSEFNRGRSFELIKQNIGRFIEGRPLFNRVDKDLGY